MMNEQHFSVNPSALAAKIVMLLATVFPLLFFVWYSDYCKITWLIIVYPNMSIWGSLIWVAMWRLPFFFTPFLIAYGWCSFAKQNYSESQIAGAIILIAWAIVAISLITGFIGCG